MRAAVGCSDRGHTAASHMHPGEVDWRGIFGGQGARCFHTGGIFAALSESTSLVSKEAMEAARVAGTLISYDRDYREPLWRSFGGRERAREVNHELAALADVVIGNEEDFTAAPGFPVAADAEGYAGLDLGAYEVVLSEVMAAYPRLEAAAVTPRARPDCNAQRLERDLADKRGVPPLEVVR
jgi:2-dehydro-3-deoxygluconokinase